MRGIWVLAWQTLMVRRNSLVAWSVSLAALLIMYVALFPSIQQIDFKTLMAQYPKELLRAFGFESVEQLGTVIGFINTELFGFMLPLAIIFLPIGVVVHVVPRAEERGYLDALLSAPLARRSLMISAVIAGTLALLVPIVVMIVVALITAQVAGVHLTLHQIANSSFSVLPLGAFAGAIATVVVGATRRHGVATAVAGGTIVVMYLVQVLAGFLTFFDKIKSLSAFHYYIDWINHGIEWVPYFGILAVACVLTAIGAQLFERRDVGA